MQIDGLDSSNLLFQIEQKFAAFDLHPDTVRQARLIAPEANTGSGISL